MYKNMDGLLNTLEIVYTLSVDIIKFVVAEQKWFLRCGGRSIIDFYDSSGM